MEAEGLDEAGGGAMFPARNAHGGVGAVAGESAEETVPEAEAAGIVGIGGARGGAVVDVVHARCGEDPCELAVEGEIEIGVVEGDVGEEPAVVDFERARRDAEEADLRHAQRH